MGEKLYKFFSSLKLTIVLLLFSMALIFFGTLDQVNYGIFEVQQKYFKSIIVLWHYPSEWIFGNLLQFIAIPMPGGYTIGFLLLINLVTAHFRFYNPSWKKLGIAMIHVGLVLLIVSGFLSGFFQIESQMWIKENEQANYSQSIRENEFVIIDKTEVETDKIYSVPQSYFKKSNVISESNIPFDIQFIKFYENSNLGLRTQNPSITTKNLATQGAGVKMDLIVIPQPKTYKEDEPNAATAYVSIFSKSGENIGTWLVSNLIDGRFPPQRFEFEDKIYEIALRFKRYYYPFWLKLISFSFDRYPGTEIPKNFSSKVQIINPGKNENRETLIYMNNPLRYEGQTFYQASYGENETMSMLQVMKNPSWQLPYWAVLIIGIGLLMQFIVSLTLFLRKRKQ